MRSHKQLHNRENQRVVCYLSLDKGFVVRVENLSPGFDRHAASQERLHNVIRVSHSGSMNRLISVLDQNQNNYPKTRIAAIELSCLTCCLNLIIHCDVAASKSPRPWRLHQRPDQGVAEHISPICCKQPISKGCLHLHPKLPQTKNSVISEASTQQRTQARCE